MRAAAVNAGNKASAAGIVLELGAIKAHRLAGSGSFHNGVEDVKQRVLRLAEGR